MTLTVRYEEVIVGRIEVDTTAPRLVYDRRWQATRGAFPVSVRMPLDRADHGPEVLLPWLANLLPEGDPLHTVGRNLGVAPADVLALLAALGKDTAGALSFDRSPPDAAPDYRQIENAGALEQILNELPRRPFLAGDDGVSMSLAGAQHKLPVALVDGRLAIPLAGAPSTHILKPDNPNLFGSVPNEALCMILARRVGLDVAEVRTGIAGKRSYLLVTRYDRRQHDGRWRRVHQEDLCQALGKPPTAKYEHNQTGLRGPGIKDFFALANAHLSRGQMLPLLDAVIFNILTANVDSHAKNYSILFPWGGGEPRLAPLYDLMCAAAWDGITKNHAQDIGGQRDGRHIAGKHWLRMANACGLSGRGVLQLVDALGCRVIAEIGPAMAEVAAMPGGAHPMLAVFGEAIMGRCETVLSNLPRAGDEQPDEQMPGAEG